MARLFFVLAVAAGAAALVFKDASEEGSAGNDWPADVCSTSKLFCNHPEYAAYVAIASIVLAIGFKLIRKL